MVQLSGDLDLTQEAIRAESCGEFGPQDLDGDLSLVPDVLSEVDSGHAALTEFALDAVPALEGRVQSIDWMGHVNTCRSFGRKPAGGQLLDIPLSAGIAVSAVLILIAPVLAALAAVAALVAKIQVEIVRRDDED